MVKQNAKWTKFKTISEKASCLLINLLLPIWNNIPDYFSSDALVHLDNWVWLEERPVGFGEADIHNIQFLKLHVEMRSGIFATQCWLEFTFAGHLNCEWTRDFTYANFLESPPEKTNHKLCHCYSPKRGVGVRTSEAILQIGFGDLAGLLPGCGPGLPVPPLPTRHIFGAAVRSLPGLSPSSI